MNITRRPPVPTFGQSQPESYRLMYSMTHPQAKRNSRILTALVLSALLVPAIVAAVYASK